MQGNQLPPTPCNFPLFPLKWLILLLGCECSCIQGQGCTPTRKVVKGGGGEKDAVTKLPKDRKRDDVVQTVGNSLKVVTRSSYNHY